MSLAALNWALVQRCGTPAAKMVLLILSRYANADGWAWPSRQTLAEASEQSPDSVDRALRLLTQRGLVEKGGRQIRHDGGDSTVRYRLLFDARAIDAHLAGNRVPPTGRNTERPAPPSEPEADEPPPVPQIAAGGEPQIAPGGEPQSAAGGAANLRLGGAADCGTSRERKEESESEPSPRTPPVGGACSGLDEGSEGSDEGRRRPERPTDRPPRLARRCRGAAPPALALDAAARFERLWAAFPENGRLPARRDEATTRFGDLAPPEQEAAIATAAAYAARCAETRSQAKALHRWLRDGLWRNGASALVPPAGPPGCPAAPPAADPFAARNAAGMTRALRGEWPTGCTHLVLADSDAGAAWEVYFDGFGVKPRWMTMPEGQGAYMPAPLPPVREAA